MYTFDTILSIVFVLAAAPLLLIGFKVINVFKDDEHPERVFKFERKFGVWLRIGGLLFLILSLTNYLQGL